MPLRVPCCELCRSYHPLPLDATNPIIRGRTHGSRLGNPESTWPAIPVRVSRRMRLLCRIPCFEARQKPKSDVSSDQRSLELCLSSKNTLYEVERGRAQVFTQEGILESRVFRLSIVSARIATASVPPQSKGWRGQRWPRIGRMVKCLRNRVIWAILILRAARGWRRGSVVGHGVGRIGESAMALVSKGMESWIANCS